MGAPSLSPRSILLFVCGEPRRGDDAAAFAAVECLSSSALQGVEVRRVGQLSPEDLVALGPNDACLIVDAVAGVPPGSVVRRDLASLLTPGDGPAPRSTHALPIPDVLGLAAELRGDLPRGAFLGIGGEAFGIGAGLSSSVDRALPAFVAAIEAELAALAGPTAR